MSRAALLWAAGLAGSAAAHLGMAALLWAAIRPEPVDEQPMPGSEFEVESYRLDRQQAREAPAHGQQAEESQAETAALAPGAIPRSRARARVPPADRLAPAQAAAGRLAAALPAGVQAAAAPAPVQQAAPARPAAQSIAPDRPAATPLAAAAQPALAVAATLPRPRPIGAAGSSATPVPAATPRPVALRAEVDAATSVPPAVPQAQGVPAATPDAAPAAASDPDPLRLTAALAFSGSGDGDVDPVSIAAFQSFMRPGDATARADPMRDGIAALLAQVPCSRLQVGFDPASATLQVNGHVPEGDLRAPVLAALKAQMGADIAVSDNILILPRPQCGMLTGIADAGLPQSTDQITNPLLIGADTHARVFGFVDGDRLTLDMTAPDYDAYLYVDYFDAGGNVLHLVPNDHAPLERTTAKAALEVGGGDGGLQLFIGPPYGQEIAVAFAASSPLYDGLRPVQEAAAPYLDWLKSRIAEARERDSGFKGEWVYFFVSTRAE
ncbi:DUF4384 domain-containing protein [Pukyongiella litopenaei]|uniref:DUF4384 domain-containing protein n=1 Tax=Pukyongiella litopenaei TaxID=2605946 RepID=A0A2S0MPD7_9RHOB|nr:DUF4384 domain-containing protein [Pukyongiella litopenaei]AVO37697.2 DUF4384 domain-containing protein [Pukyongiella litopenaei]